MIKRLAVCLLISSGVVFSLFAQAPDTLWTRTFGGKWWDDGKSVQQTTDGGYIIAGYTKSFAPCFYIYLIKTDASGNLVWQKTYGGSNYDEGKSVQETSDGGYIIAGRTESFGAGLADVYLIKTDASGDTLLTRTYGGSDYDWGNSIQETSDGGYIITGLTAFGAGNYDVYFIKTDASGNLIWQKTYGGSDYDEGKSVQETSDGGYIIAGRTYSFGAGLYDVYLIKTDASGNLIWQKTYGGSDQDEGYSVQETSDNGYIIAGRTASFGAGNYDVYFIKTDASGDTLWTRTYGGSEVDEGYSVQETPDGGYIIAGRTASFGAGSCDVYLIKTDASGNLIWQKTYGGPNYDEGYSVQQTTDGGCIIAGKARSSFGDYDVYLIKTEPDPGGIDEEFTEKIFSISRAKPNPFKNRTLIKCNLPKSNNVYIVVYNSLGEKVKILVNKKENAGVYALIWDGKDKNGHRVPAGVYFLRLETNGFSQTRKLVLLR